MCNLQNVNALYAQHQSAFPNTPNGRACGRCVNHFNIFDPCFRFLSFIFAHSLALRWERLAADCVNKRTHHGHTTVSGSGEHHIQFFVSKTHAYYRTGILDSLKNSSEDVGDHLSVSSLNQKTLDNILCDAQKLRVRIKVGKTVMSA